MDSLNNFFQENKREFDIFEPKDGHKKNFEKLLTKKFKTKYNYLKISLLAASIVIFISLGFWQYNKMSNTNEIAKTTPEIKKSTNYFSMIIKHEMEDIQKIETPDTKHIITETMLQLNMLENDYKKLLKDFQGNNENKLILNAMIENFRKRIKLLEFTKKQLEEIKKFKNKNYEYGQI